MNTAEVIKELMDYNLWRRGCDKPQPKPRRLGHVIDYAVKILKQQGEIIDSQTQTINALNNRLQLICAEYNIDKRGTGLGQHIVANLKEENKQLREIINNIDNAPSPSDYEADA